MKDTEFLNEFYKHISTNSILVVTREGKLIRLYCPFKVKAKVSFPQIEAGKISWVEKVLVSEELKDVYIINGQGYLMVYFDVVGDANTYGNVVYQGDQTEL